MNNQYGWEHLGKSTINRVNSLRIHRRPWWIFQPTISTGGNVMVLDGQLLDDLR